jgi:hypothetical protein
MDVGGQFQTLAPFIPRKKNGGAYYVEGWVDRRASLDAVEK